MKYAAQCEEVVAVGMVVVVMVVAHSGWEAKSENQISLMTPRLNNKREVRIIYNPRALRASVPARFIKGVLWTTETRQRKERKKEVKEDHAEGRKNV
ncbi:hypothetical protein E2C01_082689 [Portunus trituberculatus]|uniref:Uncharacterized protein n=1 Tax=Portunus trituberculatus TaxID=210409 RepID=A0A5B7J5T7_PORTR|nr:hypothetical protein [Portunus trituberculatus]